MKHYDDVLTGRRWWSHIYIKGLATDVGDNPLDRRYDALLLVVHGPTNFFGLSDLHMHIETEC